MGHNIGLNSSDVFHQAILKPETLKDPALFPVCMNLDPFGLMYPCVSDISPPKKYNSKWQQTNGARVLMETSPVAFDQVWACTRYFRGF